MPLCACPMLSLAAGRARSNYGNTTVDICAPGENIMSTYIGRDQQYTQLTGTSVAVPHVTGTAALMIAQ